jgi:hypothetical protein
MKPKVIAKSVMLEWRKPETKRERAAYGVTYGDNRVAKVFIDMNQSQCSLVDTFFHEMTHVFFSFHKNNVSGKAQERIATKIGKLCGEVLCR